MFLIFMKRIKNTLKRKDVAIFLSLFLVVLFTAILIKSFENMDNTKVKIETNHGDIVVELNSEASPVTVENFLEYVNSGFYEGTVFHRVIDGFMIQGGGFDEKGVQKDTRAPIKLESNNGLTNKKYSIAMARTNVPDSATSQFFINVDDNTFLDYSPSNPGYAVFGEVVKGQEVVDEIEKVSTSVRGGMSDWPVEDVVILKVVVL